ncbi:MAG: FAD-dependent oxidoreductase [Gammaproteobacteria bacterium]|nr:FAD-dependent oxidoreductase [Gammaproteobacteria bacterium]
MTPEHIISRTTSDAEWKSLIFPHDYQNPIPQDKYHLVVIGAGPAGLVTAIGAAGLGAKVALIEAKAMGGDCLNVGCVPSKALLAAAKKVKNGKLSPEKAFDWVHQVRANISHHDSVERFSDAGIDVFLGRGKFTDAHTVMVGEAQLKAKAFVIATGSEPFVPPIAGLESVAVHTNENIFDLQTAPKSIGILGGGPIGCEMAQAFADLGSEVHLFEMAEQILIREHPEAAKLVSDSLEQRGVHLQLGEAVRQLAPSENGILVTAGDTSVEVECVLAAVGRKANFQQLDLDKAGVETHKRGITVDSHFRTSQKHIFAIGDVSSKYQFTNYADAQARAVIQNALFPGNSSTNTDLLPWCTYTKPEIARIGLDAADAKERGIEVDTYRYDWKDSDRAQTEDDKLGFVEVLTKKGSDKLLGATIVGSDAGDQIAPLSVMLSTGTGLKDLSASLFCYPTRSEYLKRLSDAFNKTRLTPTSAKLLKFWLDKTL